MQIQAPPRKVFLQDQSRPFPCSDSWGSGSSVRVVAVLGLLSLLPYCRKTQSIGPKLLPERRMVCLHDPVPVEAGPCLWFLRLLDPTSGRKVWRIVDAEAVGGSWSTWSATPWCLAVFRSCLSCLAYFLNSTRQRRVPQSKVVMYCCCGSQESWWWFSFCECQAWKKVARISLVMIFLACLRAFLQRSLLTLNIQISSLMKDFLGPFFLTGQSRWSSPWTAWLKVRIWVSTSADQSIVGKFSKKLSIFVVLMTVRSNLLPTCRAAGGGEML